MRSLKNKIILGSCICVLITSLLIGVIGIQYSCFITKETTQELMGYACENSANKMNIIISSVEQSVRTLAYASSDALKNPDAFKTSNAYVNAYSKGLLASAEALGNQTPGVLNVFIRFNPEFTAPTSGLILSRRNVKMHFLSADPPALSLTNLGDPNNAWFTKPVNSKKALWLPPYYNELANSYVVTYVSPLYKEDTLIGVVGMDVDFSVFEKIIQDAQLHDDGYAFLLSDELQILSHPTLPFNSSLASASPDLAAILATCDSTSSHSDLIEYKYENTRKALSYFTLNNGMKLFMTAPVATIYSKCIDLTFFLVVVCIISIIISTIINCLLGHKISKPIKMLTTIINNTSNFDFRVNDDNNELFTLKDEIGDMARAMKNMHEKLGEMVGHIDQASHTMALSTAHLTEVTEKVSTMCMDNSATTQQLSAGMEETAATTTTMADNLTEIEKNTKDISELSLRGQHASVEIADRAHHLKEETLVMTEKITTMFQDVSEKMQIALKKAKAVETINELTDQITAIADQTSLLSLNATIEAARAGEAGRGFSVVATEISHLAQQTADAVCSINKMVAEVTDAVNSMSSCITLTNHFLGKDILDNYKTFNEIGDHYTEDANTFSLDMTEINKAITALSLTITQITEAIEGISITITEASNGVLNIANKTSDMIIETSKSTDIASQTSTSLEGLKKIVASFTLK